MNFMVDYNNNLIKRMFFYKTFSRETFKYKDFCSKKNIIEKINLESKFKDKIIIKKKDIIKKNMILQALTNNYSTIIKVKKNKSIKKNTITNITNKLKQKDLNHFLSVWFFLFNPFFQENEFDLKKGRKSIKKNFDAFKTLKLLNSKILTSNLFNFELSLKISFKEENLAEIFEKNYEC